MTDKTATGSPCGVGVQAAACPEPCQDATLASPVRRVTITVEGHGCASARVEERVLVALERAQGFGQLRGLPRKLPVGCRRGGCGVCRARVIAGDYRRDPMSREHVSTTDEAEGVVLSCAIYALTDLTLRLDSPVLSKKRPAGQDV